MYKFSCQHMLSFLLGIHPGELLYHREIMFNTLENCSTFPQSLHRLSFPLIMRGGFHFLHIPANAYFFKTYLFYHGHPRGVTFTRGEFRVSGNTDKLSESSRELLDRRNKDHSLGMTPLSSVPTILGKQTYFSRPLKTWRVRDGD